MKRCQIAAKIAGSIVFLPRCVTNVQNNFLKLKTGHRTDIEANLGPETGDVLCWPNVNNYKIQQRGIFKR